MSAAYSPDSSTYVRANEILADADMPQRLRSVAEKTLEGLSPSKEDIVWLLGLKEPSPRKHLFELATAVKHDNVGDTVFIKGIIEFSNYCKRDCAYCGIRASMNTQRYRMEPDEIVEVAADSARCGIDTVILQSGEDPYYTTEMMNGIVKRIRTGTRKPVSLSIGERTAEEFRLFRDSGATKCLLKQETVNRGIFEKVHGSDYDTRLSLLKTLVDLGYVAGGGDIIGLPGQTIEDVADDIVFMRDTGIRMAGIGPFIPTANTPLENHPAGSADVTLNAYACTRLAIPRIFLPTTTALGTIDPGLQYEGFEAGCNVIMVNFTPDKYRKIYRIYDNKRRVEFFDTARELLKRGKKLSPSVMRALREEETV